MLLVVVQEESNKKSVFGLCYFIECDLVAALWIWAKSSRGEQSVRGGRLQCDTIGFLSDLQVRWR